MNARLGKALKLTEEIFWISLGLALYAAAWNVFVLPQGFVGGGLGGICAMIYYTTGIPVAYTYLGFNVILCAIALLVLGRDFSIKTVFGILGLTFFLKFIPSPETPLVADKLLSAIMGGIIGGTGVAFYLLRGSSTGGSDIIVMIVSKYKNISWGRVYLMFDSCVILSSLLLPSSSIETVAYGFVFMGVNVYTVDMVSNGRRQSVQMFIFTSKYREVADQIIHHHHRGATLFESIGWFTKQHRKTIYLVAKKRESEAIFRTVKAIDEHAFIAVSNVMSVFGMGFDVIKAGFTKPILKDEDGNEISQETPDAVERPEKGAEKGAVAALEEKKSEDRSEDALCSEDNTLTFTPPLELLEVPLEAQDVILKDEIQGLALEKAGKEAEYNPYWETPASEISEVPDWKASGNVADASPKASPRV